MIALVILSYLCSTALLIGGIVLDSVPLAIVGAAQYLGTVYQYGKK